MSLGRRWTAGLFSVSVLVLAVALYGIFDQFLGATGDEIVKAWYFGQMVDLQEGQILPAIAKNHSLFENSPFIRSVVLIDKNEVDRPLFAVGELTKPISAKDLKGLAPDSEKITRKRIGFLENIVTARIPGPHDLYIVYTVTSSLLSWTYFLTLALGVLFVAYLMGITIKISNSERNRREGIRADIVSRLAHDLNSPLLVLSNLSLKANKLDSRLHDQLETVGQSIRTLLDQTETTNQRLNAEASSPVLAVANDTQEVPLLAVLMEFIASKRAELAPADDIKIEFDYDSNVEHSFVKANVEDLRRHLTNIIKNALDSMSERPAKRILVRLDHLGSDITLSVRDWGCGISGDRLAMIGQKGITDKAGGRGLGVYFALESVKHWRGTFKVESEVGQGTTVSIRLPVIRPPKWYQSKFVPDAEKKIVVVDDDKSMVGRWKESVGSDLISFDSADNFRQWFHSSGQWEDGLQFIFDYHLDGANTGLALIDELGLANESLLVTSAYLDSPVVDWADRLGVRVLPKVFV